MIAAASEICEERVAISASRTELSGVLAYPFGDPLALAAVIAGPHPLLGGNIRSNVVRSIRQALAESGCAALSFDYRAIDPSDSGSRDWSEVTAEFWRDGRCQEEQSWSEDFRVAASTLADSCPAVPTVAVGYSFGCWLVAQHAAEVSPAAIILVSPNPNRHDFSGLDRIDTPLLIIQSDDDFTCKPEEGQAWFRTLREPKQRCVLPTCGHFFRGRERELTETVALFLRANSLLREASC